jgi:polyhydroxyalkanoate synthesis regulator phasin
MQLRTMFRLLSLGTNLYLIAQDKELMEKLKHMAKSGKEKYDEIFHGDEESDMTEDDLLSRLSAMAGEVKEKMNQEMEAIAKKTFDKLNIAQADEVRHLKSQIEQLQNELNALRSGQQG